MSLHVYCIGQKDPFAMVGLGNYLNAQMCSYICIIAAALKMGVMVQRYGSGLIQVFWSDPYPVFPEGSILDLVFLEGSDPDPVLVLPPRHKVPIYRFFYLNIHQLKL